MLTRRTVAVPLFTLLLATPALSLAAAGDTVLPGDVRIARWLQAHPIPLAGPLTAFTNDYMHGTPLTVAGIAITAALLAARLPRAALLVVLATGLRLTNALLKTVMDSPRPTPDLVRVTERADGLGFPSGHAMGSALLLGALAYLIARPVPPLPGGEGPGVRAPAAASRSDAPAPRPRRARPPLRVAAVALCLLAILLTGYGRIHTGAHWPSDILGGYLWGSLLLALTVGVTRALRPPTRSTPSRGLPSR